MPGGDGTGPAGQGPRTGRGLGNCPPVDNQNPNQPQPSANGILPMAWNLFCRRGTFRGGRGGGGRGRGFWR